jgi:hypothetical protein
MDAVVEKPIKPAVLMSAIVEAMRSRPADRPLALSGVA